MPGIETDPEIMQAFLTECGELLGFLEGDLISLESNGADTELLNKVFRALHTIKGSASFLALTELVEITHVAESALNAARDGNAAVNRPLTDLLLRAVDVIKLQLSELESGSASLTGAEPGLVTALAAVGENKENPDAPETATPQPADTARSCGARPLALDAGKSDLLANLVEDLDSQLDRLSDRIEMLNDESTRPGLADSIEDLGRCLTATIGFFELGSMHEHAYTLVEAAAAAAKSESTQMDQIMPRMRAVLNLLSRQKEGLGEGTLIEPASGALLDRLRCVAESGVGDPGWRLPDNADDETVFRVDGVEHAPIARDTRDEPARVEPVPAAPCATAVGCAPLLEKTLRIEVSRLESLMNLVGELVQEKNRARELSRRVMLDRVVSPETAEPLGASVAGLDRITGEIQAEVMRARMQPLDKLFGRCPRLIRDLSRITGKSLQLVI
ncbi:MAG: Hpt domain-containing protein, partial [Phycisphaerales bacterium]|nr:Hpt domain-containing protein [Phycisphaerales bacterium]